MDHRSADEESPLKFFAPKLNFSMVYGCYLSPSPQHPWSVILHQQTCQYAWMDLEALRARQFEVSFIFLLEFHS